MAAVQNKLLHQVLGHDDMDVILGIDAAWTSTEPSGVSVVVRDNSDWRCVAVTPSYDSFLAYADDKDSMSWSNLEFPGSPPTAKKLLDAAKRLANGSVDVVTIDMPVATIPIHGRRAADQAISKEFGGKGCSTHSPDDKRPGQLGQSLSSQFADEGYSIGTCPRLVEVYPHPALLNLLGRSDRVPYKMSKTRKYWPSLSKPERIEQLLCEFTNIRDALLAAFGEINVPLPNPSSVKWLAELKRYEDALDALICAWVGTKYIDKKAIPYGDKFAAIWCPE